MALCALCLLTASSCKKPPDKRVETTAQTAQIREVPNLEFMYSPLIPCPSASLEGDLLLGKLNVNDEHLSYYWFSPGKLLKDTGVDFEDVPPIPLLVLADGSIIWGPMQTELNKLTGDILALQTKLGAPIDGSFSKMFPGLKGMLVGKKYIGLALYLASSNRLIIEAERIKESDYLLLEQGKAPRTLKLPDVTIVSHGYGNDLSLLFFTDTGQAYRLNSDCTKFVLDSSLHVYGKVPSFSSFAIGSEYLWVITNSGAEGIPLHEGVQRVLLPVRATPESAMESTRAMASDNRWLAMHKRRKQWVSKQGPGIISSNCSLRLIAGHVFLVDGYFHRILQLE
jgi:hypothetical protein